jgi:hypothetical protein
MFTPDVVVVPARKSTTHCLLWRGCHRSSTYVWLQYRLLEFLLQYCTYTYISEIFHQAKRILTPELKVKICCVDFKKENRNYVKNCKSGKIGFLWYFSHGTSQFLQMEWHIPHTCWVMGSLLYNICFMHLKKNSWQYYFNLIPSIIIIQTES